MKKLSFSAILLAGLSACLVWSYWPTIVELFSRWSQDPQYSHGYLVPVFGLVILWLRRDRLSDVDSPAWFWGLVWLFAGGVLRFTAGHIFLDWLDAFSLLPCLVGVALLVGGKRALAWSWPAIAFLVFMIPLPYRFEVAMSGPLRRVATVGSTYVLQTFGISALSEGNIIVLDDTTLGVAEACSGLSMLLVFFALATAVTFFSKRPMWEKTIIVLSAVPIAVISNIARITATGVANELAGHDLADLVFHGLAGLLMMVFGLALLGIEVMVLSRLVVRRTVNTESPRPLAALQPSNGKANGLARPGPAPGKVPLLHKT